MHRARPTWPRRLAACGVMVVMLALLVASSPGVPTGALGLLRAGDQPTRAAVVPAPADMPDSSIVVPAVGLAADLQPIRFVGSVLEPPEDVQTAGWWEDGAALSDGGDRPTVITGHVSDGRDRPGAFSSLQDLRVGMTATTRDAQGEVRRWRVTTTRTFAKDDLPRSVFLPGPTRVLRLITCTFRVAGEGGRFHYTENLVVDLEPLDGAGSSDRVSAQPDAP